MNDSLINFLAWFIFLCMVILPPFLCYKVIKRIVLLIKQRKSTTTRTTNSAFRSEWKWDEKRQLWVHPNSEKESVGEYQHSNKDNESPKEQPTQQTYFHHTDTSFKTKQKPEIKVTIEIPKEVQEKIKDSKREQTNQQTTSEFKDAYEATPILTRNELQNYKTLNEAAMKKGYIVWSKVRLADIIKPRNDSKYMSRFGKIKSKHVDFVILDQNMRIKAIIELDDKSHDREDRRKRDAFVDEILQDCGYKIIHTRYITPNVLDEI